MRPRLRIAMCGLSMLVAVVGCRSLFALGWSSKSGAGLVGRTESVRVPLDCPRGATRVVLSLDLDVRGGALEIVVKDPAGAERFRAKPAPGPFTEQLDYAAQAGTWIAELEFGEFTGDYGVRWSSARDRDR